MSVFRDTELRYLAGGQQLGRIATVGADGTPHVVPVGWIYNAARDTIDVGGYELERTKKFRDVARTGRGDCAAHAADPNPSRADHQLGGRTGTQRAYGGAVGALCLWVEARHRFALAAAACAG